MKLKVEIISKIRAEKRLRAEIVLGLNTTESTLYRWLRTNDRLLTTADCLEIIGKYFGLNPCDLYENAETINKNN